MEKAIDTALVWFRRDLRVADHAALYHALKAARQVWCAFVYDRAILDELPRADRRVEFIVESVAALADDLARLGQSHGVPDVRLLVRHGVGADEIVALADELHVQAVFANHDDDPYALERDARTRGALADRGVALHTSKDHVVFERNEVLTGSGKPYTVFTPYRTAWLAKLDDYFLKPYPVERHGAADIAAGAGDDRNLAGESVVGHFHRLQVIDLLPALPLLFRLFLHRCLVRTRPRPGFREVQQSNRARKRSHDQRRNGQKPLPRLPFRPS